MSDETVGALRAVHRQGMIRTDHYKETDPSTNVRHHEPIATPSLFERDSSLG